MKRSRLLAVGLYDVFSLLVLLALIVLGFSGAITSLMSSVPALAQRRKTMYGSPGDSLGFSRERRQLAGTVAARVTGPHFHPRGD